MRTYCVISSREVVLSPSGITVDVEYVSEDNREWKLEDSLCKDSVFDWRTAVEYDKNNIYASYGMLGRAHFQEYAGFDRLVHVFRENSNNQHSIQAIGEDVIIRTKRDFAKYWYSNLFLMISKYSKMATVSVTNATSRPKGCVNSGRMLYLWNNRYNFGNLTAIKTDNILYTPNLLRLENAPGNSVIQPRTPLDITRLHAALCFYKLRKTPVKILVYERNFKEH